MPLNVPLEEIAGDATGAQLSPARLPDDVSLGQQLGGALDVDNLAWNVGRRLNERGATDAPADDFNPLANLQPGEELYASRFSDARSPDEMRVIRERIEREENARKYLAKGPLNEFVATAVAVLLDPTSYVPLAGQVRGGARLLPKLARGGAAAAIEVGASEAALQSLQETRTTTESMASILLGGAFGMGLAGAGAVFSRAENAVYERAVKDFMAVAEQDFPIEAPALTAARGDGGSVGAASARPAPELTELADRGLVAPVIEGLRRVALAAPGVELMISKIPAAREAALNLVESGLVTRGQMAGVFTGDAPVDSLITRNTGTVIYSLGQALTGAYRQYVEEAGVGFMGRVFPGRAGVMSRDAFYGEVGKAMRREDTHPNPLVQEAAKAIREKVIEPMTKEAQALGLLPKDLKPETAPSYFTRVYLHDKIQAFRYRDLPNGKPGWTRRVVAWLKQEQQRLGAKVEDALSDQELEVVAGSITDRILGMDRARVPFLQVPAARGPLKERTFMIPDALIEDFLESNALVVMERFTRTLAADIAMTKRFGRPDPGEELARKILDDAAVLGKQAKTPEEALTVSKRAEKEAQLVQDLVNRIRGVRATPVDARYTPLIRLGRVFRDYNFVSKLGSVVLSAIPDTGVIALKQGVVRSFGTLITGFGTGFKDIKLGKKMAQQVGEATDIAMATTARMQLDLGERMVAETKFERGLDTLSRQFGNITLQNPWNETMKSLVSVIAAGRILTAAKKLAEGGQLTKRELASLGASGIDANMAKRMAAQEQHWERTPAGNIFTDIAEWTDRGAAEKFQDVLFREIRNTILTPGVGDAPLWTGTELGKTIFQFKRFAAMATNRIILSEMQFRDKQTLSGLMTMFALGMVATATRDFFLKGEVQDRTPGQWALDSFDRSGMAGLFMELDAISDKTFGVSMQRAVTPEGATRFQSRDVLGQLLGPTAGLIEDAATAARSTVKGEFTQADMRRLTRMIPGQNLFYLNWLVRLGQQEAAEAFDIPEKEPRGGGRKPNLPGQ